jgi:3,4-dihydroxy 2-butanone 4-phosphate synthase/GTP cyclohydrolase II
VSSTEKIEKVAEADFPCRFGDFRIFGFRGGTSGNSTGDSTGDLPGNSTAGSANGSATETVALKLGDFSLPGPPPLVRIHSQCLTGDVFGSLRCDCGRQLALALEKIADEGRGLLIYDPQEGRGIGLLNKIRAYELQDQGLDSVDANERLGFPADARDYRTAARIIELLGIASVRLLTNNPAKIAGLEQEGISITGRVPVVTAANRFNARYLATKRTRFNHLL